MTDGLANDTTPIEDWLRDAIRITAAGAPPKLFSAIEDAVFPGGARLRPRLVIAVAEAAGSAPDAPDVVAVASAVELFHCASLVHDDLPCFDDADVRRGSPSVQRRHGEAIAVLTGDALLVGGFHVLAARASPARLPSLVAVFASALSAARGIVGGQAWESEDDPNVARVHRLKTAALFEAASVAGAIAAGQDGETFRDVGCNFGLLYQLLDDVADRDGDARSMGKPTGRDRALDRPTAASGDVEARIERALAAIVAAAPAGPGRGALVTFVERAFADAAVRAGIDVRRETSSPTRWPRPRLERAG